MIDQPTNQPSYMEIFLTVSQEKQKTETYATCARLRSIDVKIIDHMNVLALQYWILLFMPFHTNTIMYFAFDHSVQKNIHSNVSLK